MNYPSNTAIVLESLGYNQHTDFFCEATVPGGPVTLVWSHVDEQPTPAFIEAQELAVFRTRAKVAIKAEANRRILAVMPDWKQRNLTARSIEIVSAIVDGTATQADHDELDALRVQKAMFVDAVRVASDAAEAEVDALTTVEAISAYDVRGW